MNRFHTDPDPAAASQADAAAPPADLPPTMPERYVVREIEGRRCLVCLEAPNIQARIELGLSVSGATARKAPPGTIYLDGAAASGPFMDHEKQVYNLDHHEGCERAFTLATCEQALIMSMKGLDLRDRQWRIFANEPDLDTALALWIIFNHMRISRNDAMNRNLLFALVRLEGVIDALGLEMRAFTAFPSPFLKRIQDTIDYLREEEIRLKSEALWQKTDFLQYTAGLLHKIDRIIYRSEELKDFKGIEELARIELGRNRVAVVVATDLGIYELEPHLVKLYGQRLGWAALRKGERHYTLRQMDMFMPVNLKDVYNRLNFIDPAVKFRTGANRWGGSAEIGGSPRESGTRLGPQQIAQALRDAFRKSSPLQQAYRFLLTAFITAAILAAGALARHIRPPAAWLADNAWGGLLQSAEARQALVLLGLTLLSLLAVGIRRGWQFGLHLPVGRSWWVILPVMVLGGLAGGVHLPEAARPGAAWPSLVTGLVLLPLALELLFRGLAHGMLAQAAPIQSAEQPWMFSWPLVGTALLFAVYRFLRALPPDMTLGAALAGWETAAVFCGALGFGLAAGLVRERSHSLLPAWLFHVLAALAAAAAAGAIPLP